MLARSSIERITQMSSDSCTVLNVFLLN